VPLDTGNTAQDAQSDFARVRRGRIVADIGRRLRREPDDVALILPFEEAVEALGRVGESDAGRHTVPLDAIVGSVDRVRDFDRSFRPTTARTRGRWERIAAARRRGEPLPPISLYRVGDLYFVRDGHHRVSVARAMGDTEIDAYVTAVRTRVRLSSDTLLLDLPFKGHERLFRERVPLTAEQRRRIQVSDPWDYGKLAEAVEAWGFRAMQERHEYIDRRQVATLWFEEEYSPVVEMLLDGGFVEPHETPADAYLRVAGARYRLLRTHEWSDEVLARVRGDARRRRRRPRRRRRRVV
jgi:hypothetical protein